MTIQSISAHQLSQQAQTDDHTLLDVRTPAEFEEVHIAGAKLHPLDSLKAEQVSEHAEGGTIYVICRSGNRAKNAIKKLASAGIHNTALLDGGMHSWLEAGLPVNRGRKTMPLERQVRIAAGFLALLGAVLGFTIHPYWHGLSGFIGAGLMFAGITDTCAMGMLIAKLPWNRRGRN